MMSTFKWKRYRYCVKNLYLFLFIGMSTNRLYSDDDIIFYAKEVKSLAGLLKALGLKTAGGNYSNMRRLLQKLNVDTSHWTGQGWCLGHQKKDWSNYTHNRCLKPHVVKTRGHQCESCKNTQWMGLPIPLELHHVDGDRTNNTHENLKLLCLNCHSFTKNFRNKKRNLDTYPYTQANTFSDVEAKVQL
jgi:hypothetical protein